MIQLIESQELNRSPWWCAHALAVETYQHHGAHQTFSYGAPT